ncbi:arylsulfotransferase family protein [Robiginitalea sediminis]|uniref:arylsulfotransferase family protein n=1 Tax=Robiginitalea sediminis TaxID=1982593 RepID=UPI000B4A9328|nr:arylsulfotransferase family protein [Robiginitalea sediminis]
MKKLRIAFIVIVAILLYSIGLSALVRNVYFGEKGKWGIMGQSVRFMAELPSNVKKALGKPEFYVANATSSDGLETFKAPGEFSYPKLLVSYKTAPFGQQFELMEVPSGKTLKTWTPDNAMLYDAGQNEKDPRRPPAGSDLYFMHALMLADSSLVFNSQLTSLLARIDKDSKVVWVKNDRNYHHTSEADAEGNIWVCSRPHLANAYDFIPPSSQAEKSLMDDSITKIDPQTGDILFDKPVIQILVENGYGDLVIQKGQLISDPIHLNDIQPALTDSPYWQKGDLLVSCRNINTVFLYRPGTDAIVWLKQGPWMNQHDADFVDSTRVSIFGNDIIREESALDPKVVRKGLFFPPKKEHNSVYVYDFATGDVTTPYETPLREENISTITSGRSEILANGDIFIEDTNNGRIIFADSTSKKMEFTKRIDPEHISSLFWSRLIKK